MRGKVHFEVQLRVSSFIVTFPLYRYDFELLIVCAIYLIICLTNRLIFYKHRTNESFVAKVYPEVVHWIAEASNSVNKQFVNTES